MRVKLLKPITENGQLKTVKKRNKNWTPPVKQPDGSFVESKEPEFVFTAFNADTIIDASDSTAAKWIAAGLAEEFKEKGTEE